MRIPVALIVYLLLAACGKEEPAPDPEREARVLLEQAQTAEDQSELGKAEALLEQILTRYPQSAAAKDAQAEIASLRKKCEEAALAAIREINQAQSDYIKRFRRYSIDFPELTQALMLRAEPSKDRIGYVIELRPAANAGSYRLLAEPVIPSPGKRSFFSDQSGVIREETGKAATAESPKVAG